MDIESNLIQEEKQESTSDMFELIHWDLSGIRNEILSIATSKRFIYILTQKNVVYRWTLGNSDSLKQEYTIPVPQEIANQTCPPQDACVYCDPIGNHALIKYNKRMYYFNGNREKIKELPGLKGIEVISVAFDERNEDPKSTQEILLTDSQSRIILYKIDCEKDDRVKESFCMLFNELDPKDKIYGIHVSTIGLIFKYFNSHFLSKEKITSNM